MALKHSITKAEYDKLSDDLKEHYEKKGDGYALDVDGLDDPDELRRARDREKEDNKKLKKDLKAAQDRLSDIEGDDNRKKGDIDKIDSAWKEKLAAKEAELTGKLSAKDEFIKRTLIDAAADGLAAKISTTPKLMSKAIRDRLTVSFEGDEPKLVILGDDGKPSNVTLDKLEKEFVTNKEFAAIIIGSKASGGGAPRKSEDNKGGAFRSDEKPNDDLSKLSPKDLAARLKARKEADAET